MVRFMSFISSVVLFCATGQGWAAPLQSDSPQAGLTGAEAAVILPAQTKVELSLTIPIWASTAKQGDPIYAQTNFPVTSGNSIAIPAGTWVEGRIEAVTNLTPIATSTPSVSINSQTIILVVLFTAIIVVAAMMVVVFYKSKRNRNHKLMAK